MMHMTDYPNFYYYYTRFCFVIPPMSTTIDPQKLTPRSRGVEGPTVGKKRFGTCTEDVTHPCSRCSSIISHAVSSVKATDSHQTVNTLFTTMLCINVPVVLNRRWW